MAYQLRRPFRGHSAARMFTYPLLEYHVISVLTDHYTRARNHVIQLTFDLDKQNCLIPRQIKTCNTIRVTKGEESRFLNIFMTNRIFQSTHFTHTVHGDLEPRVSLRYSTIVLIIYNVSLSSRIIALENP